MSLNEDLARWGEPPADASEIALAEALAQWLEHSVRGAAVPNEAGLPPVHGSDAMLQTNDWLTQMVHTVARCSGVFENLPLPAAAGAPTQRVNLHLAVIRPEGPAPGRATTLRDLRRVPDEVSKAVLRTGERVRIEVMCDQLGYLTVFNIGPRGTLNLLHPEDIAQARPVRASERLTIADVVLTPPAGTERLYAVWSRIPLASNQLAWLAGPGVTTRDMKRVQDTLEVLHPDDWHAVLLELEHRA